MVDSDWVAPFITLNAPNPSSNTLNEPFNVSFSCMEQGSSGLARACDGTVASGTAVDTVTAGSLHVHGLDHDNLGNHRSVSHTYDVTAGEGPLASHRTPQDGHDRPGRPRRFGGYADPDDDRVHRTQRPRRPRSRSTFIRRTSLPRAARHPRQREVDIDLGGFIRPADDPIVITFVVDSSTGADPANITVSRTNADSSTDIALSCDAVPTANPNPCYVAVYTAGVGSDVRAYRRDPPCLAVARPSTDRSDPACRYVDGDRHTRFERLVPEHIGVSRGNEHAELTILTSSGCGPTTIGTDTAGTFLTCSATSAGLTSMMSLWSSVTPYRRT